MSGADEHARFAHVLAAHRAGTGWVRCEHAGHVEYLTLVLLLDRLNQLLLTGQSIYDGGFRSRDRVRFLCAQVFQERPGDAAADDDGVALSRGRNPSVFRLLRGRRVERDSDGGGECKGEHPHIHTAGRRGHHIAAGLWMLTRWLYNQDNDGLAGSGH